MFYDVRIIWEWCNMIISQCCYKFVLFMLTQTIQPVDHTDVKVLCNWHNNIFLFIIDVSFGTVSKELLLN